MFDSIIVSHENDNKVDWVYKVDGVTMFNGRFSSRNKTNSVNINPDFHDLLETGSQYYTIQELLNAGIF